MSNPYGPPPQHDPYAPPGGFGAGAPQGAAPIVPAPNLNAPIARSEAVRSIVTAVLLTIVTCGIYGMYWQYKQFETVNAWLGREELSFGLYLVVGILTCGLFFIYYEYKFANAMVEVQRQRGMRVNDSLPLMALLLAIFGLQIITWCMEQQEINAWYGEG
jgi:hypothetical protein